MDENDTLMEIVEQTAKEVGAQQERNRILTALLKADLPVGVWTLIKDIVHPKE